MSFHGVRVFSRPVFAASGVRGLRKHALRIQQGLRRQAVARLNRRQTGRSLRGNFVARIASPLSSASSAESKTCTPVVMPVELFAAARRLAPGSTQYL